MSRVDKLMYAFLFLVSLILIGMILGAWRMVLYPYLIVIGLSIVFGLLKEIETDFKKLWIPLFVSFIYLILYIAHDMITAQSPTGGTDFIFGLTPAMALYLVGIWPMAVLVCLLYAWTFSNPKDTGVE